jgi:hypothetical protein
MTSPVTGAPESKYTRLDRTELWTQLANVIQLRSSQAHSLWTGFGAFWVVNALLIVALFPGGVLPSDPVGMLISLFGGLLALIWYSIQERAVGHLLRHEALMSKLETTIGFDPTYAVSGELNQELYETYLKKGLKVREVLKISSMGGIAFWLVMLVVFIGRLFLGMIGALVKAF